MSGFLFLLVGLGAMLGAGPARADVGEIRALEAEHKQLAFVQDSLKVQHAQLMHRADSLSVRIDRFKAVAADSEELQEALRASLVLEQRLVETDHQLEVLKIKREAQRERLRLAYDWEIGVLIQRLAWQPDQGLLQQLVIYQEAREALGEKVAGMGLRYGENMDISPDDSPDEISQKAELMEDIATRLEGEARETTKRLSRLEEEHRLRSRVRIFTTEIRLFDEHLPQGRVLSRVEITTENPAARNQEEFVGDEVAGPAFEGGNDAAFGPSSEDDFTTTQEVLVAHRELVRGEGMAQERLGVNDIVLEIRRLKAHQQEIRHLEAIARERAEVFRVRLLKLLEGNE